MTRRLSSFIAVAMVGLLAGCSFYEPRPVRPAWRNQVENACNAEHPQLASEWVRPQRSIDGPGICGLQRPYRITALDNGRVALNSHFLLGCPMIEAMNHWIVKVVQPAAQARFGEPIIEVSSMGTYACRTMDNRPGARLSEHSFGNAMDIGGFTLQDGRKITIVHDWTRGDPTEQAFLRDVEGGACGVFTTVLGPGADRYHYNHLHLDLAMHGNSSHGPRRYCKPKPSYMPLPPRIDHLPDAPQLDEPMDVARRESTPGYSHRQNLNGPALDFAVPPQVVAIHPLPLASAPAHHPRQNSMHGTMRSDGVFVPDNFDPSDTTSSIRKRP